MHPRNKLKAGDVRLGPESGVNLQSTTLSVGGGVNVEGGNHESPGE